jgi:hypothetical protein
MAERARVGRSPDRRVASCVLGYPHVVVSDGPLKEGMWVLCLEFVGLAGEGEE